MRRGGRHTPGSWSRASRRRECAHTPPRRPVREVGFEPTHLQVPDLARTPGSSTPCFSTPRRNRTFTTEFRRLSAAVPSAGVCLKTVLRTGIEPVHRASETQFRSPSDGERISGKGDRNRTCLGGFPKPVANQWPTPLSVPAAGVEPAPPRLQRSALPGELHREILHTRKNRMPAVGVEPTTIRLKGGDSAIELHQPRKKGRR